MTFKALTKANRSLLVKLSRQNNYLLGCTCTITVGAWQLEFSNQKSIKTRR